MSSPRTLLSARWVVGHEDGGHRLLHDGCVVYCGNTIEFVGHDFPGEVDHRIDCGNSLIGPGFIDLDALSDLDTTVLGFDNHPGWRKGRVWPETYMAEGPVEMYTLEELVFQKRYAFTRLIANGITTALPIASLFYRAWGETTEEFAAAAEIAAELGLRIYLGPAYRAGNAVVDNAGAIGFHFDEERGLAGLRDAIAFCERFEGTHGGLVRTMLAPDRIETGTAALLTGTAAAATDLDVPFRLHCCQSPFEYESILKRHGRSPVEWLKDLDVLSSHAILPHGIYVAGHHEIAHQGDDIAILRDSGAGIAHCPLVFARHGIGLDSLTRYRYLGINVGLGTDTHPPDMLLNMQVGAMMCRLADDDDTRCKASDLYDAATLGGARALGRDDLGRLEAGARADIVAVDLGAPAMGQVIDPIQTLLLNASGREVTMVVIDGRTVMQDGCIPGHDARELRARAQTQFDGLVARYPQRTVGHPPLEEIFSTTYPVVRRPA